ncbi:hypothetical protein, partial [Parvimonas micra]|uniref:hypothetical protein n=1 Tax=Parvimonas micra TaxID=33033 RepID=UPI002B479BFD
RQGRDSLGFDLGANPLRLYSERARSENLRVGSGDETKVLLLTLQLSYEIAENLFIDINVNKRSSTSLLSGVAPEATIVSGGIRWNMARREF